MQRRPGRQLERSPASTEQLACIEGPTASHRAEAGPSLGRPTSLDDGQG